MQKKWLKKGLSLLVVVAIFGILLTVIPTDKNRCKRPQSNQIKPFFPISISVNNNLDRLVNEAGFSSTEKYTIQDLHQRWNEQNRPSFQVISSCGKAYTVEGSYYLSVLFQILKKAQLADKKTVELDPKDLFENPVERLSSLIKNVYWQGLTRRVDREHIEQALIDDKTASETKYLYVPYNDEEAYQYFSQIARGNLRVEKLPEMITPKFVQSLNEGKHGLLCLALEKTDLGEYKGVPFVVPGGRFNEMYGWDSYFESLGLLVDGKVELAKAMVDNFIYQIEHYGKILNANRTYYLTRSQPPFLTSMFQAVYEKLPKNPETKQWLKKALSAAIKEYHQVWMNKDRLTPIGLSRYYGNGIGPSPEVEPEHFDPIYARYAKKYDMDPKTFKEGYINKTLQAPDLDQFFIHDRAVRESGHDTTYRWDDRCTDFVTVDLNALLYKTEIDIAKVIETEFEGSLEGETSHVWHERANQRKELINKYLWNEQKGLFFDYDFINQKQSQYVSATTLYPLWACHPSDPKTKLITSLQAQRLMQNALSLLEMSGGIAGSDEKSRGEITPARTLRQWDFPHGWAPHQMIAWQGCLNYGFKDTAYRLIYRWLYTIAKNATDFDGMVPEKFDVVTGSHAVFAEYGNVGTEFDYITEEGFGWMNASYQVGLKTLKEQSPESYSFLKRLVSPDWLFQKCDEVAVTPLSQNAA